MLFDELDGIPFNIGDVVYSRVTGRFYIILYISPLMRDYDEDWRGMYLATIMCINPAYDIVNPAVLRDLKLRPYESETDTAGYISLEDAWSIYQKK